MLAVVEQPRIENVEEEAALLGAMMQERSLIDPIADRLRSEHFSEPLHGRIFDAILTLHSQGRPATAVTLKPIFADDPFMREVGGASSYLVNIMGSHGVTVIGAKGFADDIRELALKRKLIEGLRDVMTTAHVADIAALAASVEEALAGVNEARIGTSELSAGTCVREALEYTGHGVTSGIPELDRIMGPIIIKDLVVLAGRPGMGKTATALSYAIGAAQKGHGVLFINIEMSAVQLGARMAADWCFDRGETQVPFDAITAGKLDMKQSRAIIHASEALDALPLTVIDAGRVTTGQIERMIRRWKRRYEARGHRLDLVIVDYLQRVRPDKQTNGRTEEITQVSLGLKEAAKINDVGMLATAQLSREVERRHDKRPVLSDLRESGQIEQDADAVLFLFRPEYYVDLEEVSSSHPDRLEWEQSKSKVRGQLEFICAKQRQGRTGVARGTFYGNFQAVR